MFVPKYAGEASGMDVDKGAEAGKLVPDQPPAKEHAIHPAAGDACPGAQWRALHGVEVTDREEAKRLAQDEPLTEARWHWIKETDNVILNALGRYEVLQTLSSFVVILAALGWYKTADPSPRF
jgi:hypothetical protein